MVVGMPYRDKEFYSAGCNKPEDYIVTNPGSIATFRWIISYGLQNL